MTERTGSFYITPTLPVYTFEGPEAGVTAIIQAGIHGDEVAGAHALCEWLEEGVTIERGRLLIIPVLNPPAYRNRTRTAPDGLDLNRCFPGDPKSEHREQRLAHQLMQLVLKEQPAVIATLHESTKRFHPEVPVSFGQTVVYGVEPKPAVVDHIVSYMNETLKHPYELWAPHYYPVDTSSTEVIVEATGAVGLCIETWLGFDERRRIAMQRQVVQTLLSYYQFF